MVGCSVHDGTDTTLLWNPNADSETSRKDDRVLGSNSNRKYNMYHSCSFPHYLAVTEDIIHWYYNAEFTFKRKKLFNCWICFHINHCPSIRNHLIRKIWISFQRGLSRSDPNVKFPLRKWRPSLCRCKAFSCRVLWLFAPTHGF